MLIIMEEYLRNQGNPYKYKTGDDSSEYPSLVLIIFSKVGLINAINTVAPAWVPPVSEKISMVKPKMNPDISKNQPGVLKGKIKIKRT